MKMCIVHWGLMRQAFQRVGLGKYVVGEHREGKPGPVPEFDVMAIAAQMIHDSYRGDQISRPHHNLPHPDTVGCPLCALAGHHAPEAAHWINQVVRTIHHQAFRDGRLT